MSYRDLKSYQSATVIYDLTADFIDRYVKPKRGDSPESEPRSFRTADQMLQAARSGRQNIVEGSSEKTSRQNELRLIGVARASFEELLADFEDFLRQRDLPQWGKDDPRAKAVRALAYKPDQTDKTYQSYLSDPEAAANALICLIHQCNYLLDQQIRALEARYARVGGYREELKKKRATRGRPDPKKAAFLKELRERFGPPGHPKPDPPDPSDK